MSKTENVRQDQDQDAGLLHDDELKAVSGGSCCNGEHINEVTLVSSPKDQLSGYALSSPKDQLSGIHRG